MRHPVKSNAGDLPDTSGLTCRQIRDTVSNSSLSVNISSCRPAYYIRRNTKQEACMVVMLTTDTICRFQGPTCKGRKRKSGEREGMGRKGEERRGRKRKGGGFARPRFWKLPRSLVYIGLLQVLGQTVKSKM